MRRLLASFIVAAFIALPVAAADKHITPGIGGVYGDVNGFHIGVFLNKTEGWTGPLYEWLILHLDGNGWNECARVAGPDDASGWQGYLDHATPSPGLGNYVYMKLPGLNAAMKACFDKLAVPPLNNTTPFSPEAFNLTLGTFFQIVPDASGTYPIMVPK